MTHVSISIEFIMDKENRLHALSGLINDDSFLTAVSLAPGAAMVSKTIAELAEKVITTFLPAEERQPILQFSGDFNLVTGKLQEGYYVILGTRDESKSFPDLLPSLRIENGDLVAGEDQVVQWSYVVLDVRSTEVRTRELSAGAAWEARLREAEDEVQNVADNPFATDQDRQSAWEKCRNLLKEAQALLRADPDYLRHETENIVKASLSRCINTLRLETHKGQVEQVAQSIWQPNTADWAWLEISPDEDLNATLDAYAAQVAQARRILGRTEFL
jgi:hypothetical protein